MSGDVSRGDIASCDAVISIKGNSFLTKKIAECAKKSGRDFILLMDDALLHPSPGRHLQARFRREWLKEIIALSDMILTPNELLGREYAAMKPGGKFAVINAVVEEDEIMPPDTTDPFGKTRILYAADKGHTAYFDRYVRPALPAIADLFGEKLSLTFIGPRPDLKEYEGKFEIHFVATMPFEAYQEYMRIHRFDIGIAPLDADYFCGRKYFNKYLEYAAHGIAGVYSNCAPYTFVVEDGVNGFLCENNPEGWRSGLSRAIEDHALREQCVERSQKQLRERFTVARVHNELREALSRLDACESSKSRDFRFFRLAKYEYKLHKLIELAYIAMQLFRREGASAASARIAKFILLIIRRAFSSADRRARPRLSDYGE
jgi:glycosyltransferase involved in cell wall biosynthesis